MSTFLNTAVNIIEFVVAFGLLVFLHELGHYITAKLSGIEVEEFGFGFPPKMVKLFRWKGTDFTLNWLPFGGFCRLKGESATDMSAGSFAAASPWKRLWTLLGGPVMNLTLGFILVVFLFMKVGGSDTSKVQVYNVASGSPAETAGVMIGDIIAKINSDPVTGMNSLSALVQANLEKNTELTLIRGDETLVVELVPRANPPEGQGSMGVTITNPDIEYSTVWQAAPAAFMSTLDQGYQLLMLVPNLINGQITAAEARPTSVVGLYTYYDQIKAEDEANAAKDPSTRGLFIVSYLASISIALGYTNLLPIPAIDGGRILFLIPELFFKKRIKPEFENRVHLIGFSILIILMVVLVINDIVNPVSLP